jgi:hypothetical protein
MCGLARTSGPSLDTDRTPHEQTCTMRLLARSSLPQEEAPLHCGRFRARADREPSVINSNTTRFTQNDAMMNTINLSNKASDGSTIEAVRIPPSSWRDDQVSAHDSNETAICALQPLSTTAHSDNVPWNHGKGFRADMGTTTWNNMIECVCGAGGARLVLSIRHHVQSYDFLLYK